MKKITLLKGTAEDISVNYLIEIGPSFANGDSLYDEQAKMLKDILDDALPRGTHEELLEQLMSYEVGMGYKDCIAFLKASRKLLNQIDANGHHDEFCRYDEGDCNCAVDKFRKLIVTTKKL